jgi:enoyl-CoA hydratase
MTKEGFMKALTRLPIFSYNTLATTLLIPTKSLEIKFRKKYLTSETLFELESVLAWAATHTEVQSLFISSFGDEFIQGFDPAEIKTLSVENIKKQFSKASTIAQSLLCLSQTVVVDMKNGTKGIGLELALAADIRIAKSSARFCFNHLSQGLTPACGMFSFLKPFLNQNVLRSLLLSGTEFGKESLLALGGWCEFDIDAAVILSNIFSQAPVARMQAKRGLYGINQAVHQNDLEVETQLFNAVLQSEDYTRESDFMNPVELKEKIREIHN